MVEGFLDWNTYLEWDIGAPSSVAIPVGYGLTLYTERRFLSPAFTAYNAYEKYICVEWTEMNTGEQIVVSNDVINA